MKKINEILKEYKNGSLKLESAVKKIDASYFKDMGHTVIDNNRKSRTGYSEVIYCAGKKPEQVRDIFLEMSSSKQSILATKADISVYKTVAESVPDAVYYETARIITLNKKKILSTEHPIVVINAGTSDLPISEEAAVTAEFYGNKVLRINDSGVAGIHRLFSKLEIIRAARVLVVVAGMEGALPSVVAGMVDKPVIAVPTSIGYGASFGGLAALLGMLNSCASGLSVVNIDNGFGAGYLASMINEL